MKTTTRASQKQRSLQTLLSGWKTNLMGRTVLLMICIIFLLLVMIYSCKKDSEAATLHYYEVGVKGSPADWRDSSFIIATNNSDLISLIDAQLFLPLAQRKIVNGELVSGNGGYNKNASHQFKWHFNEDNWELADFSVEIYDGRAFTDVDTDIRYWLDTVKRFAPWSSYIKKEISKP